MNVLKQDARRAVLADRRLLNTDKIVLLGMIDGCTQDGEGRNVFSQPYPAWSFSIDTPPRTLVITLSRLRRAGYITQLSKKFARLHRWQVNIADIAGSDLLPTRPAKDEARHFDFSEEAIHD